MNEASHNKTRPCSVASWSGLDNYFCRIRAIYAIFTARTPSQSNEALLEHCYFGVPIESTATIDGLNYFGGETEPDPDAEPATGGHVVLVQ